MSWLLIGLVAGLMNWLLSTFISPLLTAVVHLFT